MHIELEGGRQEEMGGTERLLTLDKLAVIWRIDGILGSLVHT